MQKQIKITISEESLKLIEKKAKKLGMTKSAYCYNLVFEHIRNEIENSSNKKEVDKNE